MNLPFFFCRTWSVTHNNQLIFYIHILFLIYIKIINELFFVCSMKRNSKNQELKELYKHIEKIKSICSKDKGLWNIIGYEKDWPLFSKSFDFLDKNSDYFYQKDIEKQIYMNQIKPFLKFIPKNSKLLDLGGGIGRFAIPLAKMGYFVNLVDGCKTNIKVAKKHINEFKLSKKINTKHQNLEKLSFNDNIFHASLAIEAICYSSHPEDVLKELIRVTKNNGLLFISVEGKYGSIISDINVNAERFSYVYKKRILSIENHVYTKYFTKESFRYLLENFNLEIKKIVGCNYTSGGILNRFSNAKKKEILEIESICRNDKILEPLARTWFAICVVRK